MVLLADSMYRNAPDLRARFVYEVGDGYLFGLLGGSAFHFCKGLRNSPNGGRLADAAVAVRSNAPRIAGSFAAFWAVWSAFECGLIRARRKEDRWNYIAAGAAASGFVDLRRGARVATRSFFVWGAIFALLEGVDIALHRALALLPPDERTLDHGPVNAPRRHVDHGYKSSPSGFLGIPQGPPIVVQELPADKLVWSGRDHAGPQVIGDVGDS